jgi:ribosome maturation factor RimP
MAKIAKSLGVQFGSPPRRDVGLSRMGVAPIFFWPDGSASWGNECECAPARGAARRCSAWSVPEHLGVTVQLTELIETTVSGLGYELVELERAGGGLLRISIDQPAGIAIEDCEKVTRQLQYLLEVENIDYSRLEVGSPGLDRPLKKLADFERFAGSEAIITLKKPLDGRKSYRGIVHAPDGDKIGLEFEGKDGAAMLDFTLADLDKARLVPKVDFRSRKQ